MARLLQAIVSKVSNIFRRRPKMPPPRVRKSRETLGGGHRGIAAGDLRPGKQDLSPENVAKWRGLTGSEVEDFVYEATPMIVHSTNVNMLQFFIDAGKLVVEYKDGSRYTYDNVTEDEAIQFAKAPSKGGAVWDLLRVRGSKTAHKKNYRRV